MATNETFAPIEAVVDELARSGLEHAVTCPGSRNAPIALSLAAEPRVRCLSVLDERSAGFLALGIAKATRKPVAVTCTSGTAAANLLPAVVEAHQAQVALLVLTADRPPELREVGAGQAIDQLKLYGTAAKWFVEVGNHPPTRESAVHYRALACRAYHTAQDAPQGVVHLNFGLREPLAPSPTGLEPDDWRGRPDGLPWIRRYGHAFFPDPADIEQLTAEIERTERGAIVCGETSEPIAAAVARLAEDLGWPVLAEPASGLRCGPHDRSHVIAHYDALLRLDDFASEHAPGLVLRVGRTPTSASLRNWLKHAPRQVVIDPHGGWHEPTRVADLFIAADSQPTLSLLADKLGDGHRGQPQRDWIAAWRFADARVLEALDSSPEPFEPKAYAALADALPPGAIVWLSSSMPIRDIETFFPQTKRPLRFLANRGANGIDGVISSALGAAIGAGARTFVICGELALLHDMAALVSAKRYAIDTTILCVNNGGGGIFDYLPVARHADPALYDEHVLTPTQVPLDRLAHTFDYAHVRVETAAELKAALDPRAIVELSVDRLRSQSERQAVFERLRDLLRTRRKAQGQTPRTG